MIICCWISSLTKDQRKGPKDIPAMRNRPLWGAPHDFLTLKTSQGHQGSQGLCTPMAPCSLPDLWPHFPQGRKKPTGRGTWESPPLCLEGSLRLLRWHIDSATHVQQLPVPCVFQIEQEDRTDKSSPSKWPTTAGEEEQCLCARDFVTEEKYFLPTQWRRTISEGQVDLGKRKLKWFSVMIKNFL